jgi:tetratricopeptide (TPR) repeat protein
VQALINKGNALYSLGQYSRAITSYDKALALNSTDPNALNNKANTLGKLGRYLEAIQYYKKAIQLTQTNQSSNASTIYYHATPKDHPIYIFVLENQGSSTQFIQAASSEYNGQDPTSDEGTRISDKPSYQTTRQYQG